MSSSNSLAAIEGSGQSAPDMTTHHLSNLGRENGADWPQKTHSLRSSFLPAVLDPTLLHDLAEGLEFLNRQLDDSEAELGRSREQSTAFEQDARRWETEASRLREEGAETRGALQKLREEFEDGREAGQQQRDLVERLAGEMAEVRATRVHLEQLAAEQQRALVLSLELLKRMSDEGSAERLVSGRALTVEDSAKDDEIAELQRMISVDGREHARTEDALAAAKADLQSSRSQFAELNAQLERARVEFENVQGELTDSRSEIQSIKAGLAEVRSESERLRVAALQAPLLSSSPLVSTLRLAELEQQVSKDARKLKDADAEIAIQTAEVESRGAIITALEDALEEQNTSLRTLEERFLAYAEQVQALQLHGVEMPARSSSGIGSRFVKLFSPVPREKPEK